MGESEKKYLRGMYGDFFGNKENPDGNDGSAAGGNDGNGGSGTDGSGKDSGGKGKSTGADQRGGNNSAGRASGEGTGTGADAGTSPLTFGEPEESSKSSSKALSGKNGRRLEDRIDALEERGRAVTEKLSSRADALIGRQRAMSGELKDRNDALRRANDALREVQSLLDNPLYDGMPDLTGRGKGGKSSDEIDPGLMAGSDGDLFAGFPGASSSGNGAPQPGAAGDFSGGTAGIPSDGSAGNLSGSTAGDLSGGSAGIAQAEQQAQAAQAAEEEREKEPEKDPMEELNGLIGLSKIKHDVRELTDFVRIQKMRKDGGLKSVPVSLHLVFTGNPGTGKTTVARILARLYRQIGVLSKGQLVEVDRSGLVAGYVGQTALKTAKKIEEAKGGILFIDEAYALSRRDDTFGQEAIDTILKAMEDNREDFVVIVAGYTGPMENFINSNPGLKSRFNKYIEFPDYTIDELMGIFEMNCSKYDYEAEDAVKAQVRAMIVQRRLASGENFANAREVRNLFEEIITNQARRVAAMESPTQEELKTILLEDLQETAEEDAEKTLQKAAAAEETAQETSQKKAAAAEDAETALQRAAAAEEAAQETPQKADAAEEGAQETAAGGDAQEEDG